MRRVTKSGHCLCQFVCSVSFWSVHRHRYKCRQDRFKRSHVSDLLSGANVIAKLSFTVLHTATLFFELRHRRRLLLTATERYLRQTASRTVLFGSKERPAMNSRVLQALILFAILQKTRLDTFLCSFLSLGISSRSKFLRRIHGISAYCNFRVLAEMLRQIGRIAEI